MVAFCDRRCNVIAPFVCAPGNRNESPLLRDALPGLSRMARAPDAQDKNEFEELFLVDSLGRATEEAFHPLALSPLSTTVIRGGTSVDVHIYRSDNNGRDGWVLEIVDSFGTSTVWDDLFPTDGAALAEAFNTIDAHGIESVTGEVPAHVTKH